MKKKTYKIIAVYLALNLLFEIVAPTVALALTNGPSQPEMESFEPVGTTEMVDPFSGDFNYNIPLMTVPGPNGGYPINLAYHAGIGMEQEASWVGLGWNINVGEISRQMRGLPDDFNGDLVNQTRYMTPNITASLTGKTSIELVGLDASIGFGVSASFGLAWNSYQGIGITSGQGINAKLSGESNSFSGGLNTNYNSFTGTTDLSASLSYTRGHDKKANEFGLSFTRNSVEGIKSMDFNASYKKFRTISGGLSFSGSSFIPHADMPNTGFSVMTSFDMGLDIFGVNPYVGVEASYSQNKLLTHSIDFKSYGYLNSQYRDIDNEDYSIMDFNREKDHSLTKDIPALPMPMFTNDLYFVKGQGVGGVFRSYRSDIGILKDPVIKSKNFGGSLGVEVGVPAPTTKIAADITLSYSKAYSGPWRDANMWSGIKDIAKFEDKNINTPLYEPYYFKNAGDMTANFTEETRLLGPEEAFPIKMAFGISASDFVSPTLASIEEPLADVRVDNLTTASAPNLLYSKLQYRQSRTQMMSLKTRTQMVNPSSSSTFSENTIYDPESYPRHGNPPISYDPTVSSTRRADHTAEITVINPDGNRYIYGIPAYNISTKEVTFSVDKTNITENPLSDNNRLVDYTVDDASGDNNKNDDHFYNSKSLPPYAHSYLLTAIVSPDYVDLTNNGLTSDDYGYYTKFNYSKIADDYKWRSPYRKANFIDGFHSISNDDKAGYVYGQKEIWYLNSIETKTHVAEFHLSPRADGFGAVNEKNVSGFGQSVQKLDKIDLYSKNDASYLTEVPVPIKTVNFEYTYDLCGFAANNDTSLIGGTNYHEEHDRNENRGKLTLKKVWFTFLGNQKGSLSPYEFDYNERVISGGTAKEIKISENPNYSVMKMDRWGNYKPIYNEEDPYVEQSSDATSNAERDINSSAWCLKGILLPSGGKITIDYESDDYAYVQDQQAMQMAKILATARWNDATSSIVVSNDGEITEDYLYLLFELENQAVNSNLDIYPYVKNIKDMYFKTYQKLKKYYATADPAYDYVNGYAKVEGSNPDGTFNEDTDAGPKYGFITYQGNSVGYVKLAYVNVHDSKYLAGLDHTNPLRKAGFQYLKLSRPDLLSPSSTNNLSNNPTTASLLQLATATISYFSSNVQLLTGYYNYCMIAGFCKKIEILPNYPSFIRVNSPDKIKYGGGHRVKRIVETDTWTGSATSNEYGQEYSYRMPDQTSSGVACYEPLIGGEEIPLRLPIRYNSEHFIVQRNDLYMEYPYCESYYPGAQVGYSRVIVKGIQHKDASLVDVNKGTQGITLYEFYTAKDFPVSVKSSDLPHKFLKLAINIPFIGNISFDNHGFSQNFTVETNDMNGKLKGVSTYPYGTVDLTEHNAVSKTNYIYKTDAPYTANGKNQLNNSVDVLFDDAYHKTANIGLSKENFIDMRERSSVSMINGGQINLEYTPPALAFGSFFPRVNYSEHLDKIIVSMNVINRNGILMETQQLNEGSLVKTKNLMFDAATGDPLLTTVTNNFDNPVYSYDYAAQWAYDGMGAAYKNTGAGFSITSTGGGVCQLQLASGTVVGAPENYLSLGDEVSLSTDAANKYWVTNINPGATGNFTLQNNIDGLYSSGAGTMTIMRSGRRNLQNVSSGSIVSLSNPVAEKLFPLFDEWNNYLITNFYKPPDGTRLFFTDCVSGANVTATVNYTTPGTQINFSLVTGWSDTGTVFWCSDKLLRITFPLTNEGNYILQKSGNKVYASLNDLIGSKMQGTWLDPDNCLKECLPDVLHASASEFKENWSSEIDIVQQDIYNNQTATPAPFLNAYASGKQGIWRTTKTNVFQVDRKRSAVYTAATDISKDGTFTNFVLFDWTEAVLNPLWTTSSTVSKINPYGYEIENMDALGIFSSAMYGYNNSLQTAIATNAQYYETAFDGFEDYASTYASHGHINLEGITVLSSVYAHTGKKSLLLGNDESAAFTTRALSAMPLTDINHFTPLPNKKYLLSTWYRSSTNGAPGAPAISVTGAGIAAVTALSYSPVIDGWIKAELAFTTVATVDPVVTVTITGNSTSTYVDDIRIQPFQSTMKTYVYDPEKLWLKAELDNQNFATFYNYDQEGTMFQVKKETVMGVSTIKTTRNNIKRRLP